MDAFTPLLFYDGDVNAFISVNFDALEYRLSPPCSLGKLSNELSILLYLFVRLASVFVVVGEDVMYLFQFKRPSDLHWNWYPILLLYLGLKLHRLPFNGKLYPPLDLCLFRP